MFLQLSHKMHSVEVIFLPSLIYFIGFTSIGQFLSQSLHSIHSFLEGSILSNAMLEGTFITKETGQMILQKALFFLKMKAKGMAKT